MKWWTPQQFLAKAIFSGYQTNTGVRLHVGKARQVGSTALISAFIFYNLMNTDGGARAIVYTDNKAGAGKPIIDMYGDFWNSVCEPGEDLVVEPPHIHFPNGSYLYMAGNLSDSGFHRQGFDYVHLTDAQDHPYVDDIVDDVPNWDKSKSLFMETSGSKMSKSCEMYWLSETIPTFFLPWYIHHEYSLPFKSNRERYQFEDDMQSLSIFQGPGKPFKIEQPGVPQSLFPAYADDWRVKWTRDYDMTFSDYEITSENVHWYYRKWQHCMDMTQMKRDYPSLSDQLFLRWDD